MLRSARAWGIHDAAGSNASHLCVLVHGNERHGAYLRLFPVDELSSAERAELDIFGLDCYERMIGRSTVFDGNEETKSHVVVFDKGK